MGGLGYGYSQLLAPIQHSPNPPVLSFAAASKKKKKVQCLERQVFIYLLPWPPPTNDTWSIYSYSLPWLLPALLSPSFPWLVSRLLVLEGQYAHFRPSAGALRTRQTGQTGWMGQGKGEGGSLWWTDSVEVAGVGVGTVVGVEEGCGEGSGSEGHISELCMERSKNKNK